MSFARNALLTLAVAFAFAVPVSAQQITNAGPKAFAESTIGGHAVTRPVLAPFIPRIALEPRIAFEASPTLAPSRQNNALMIVGAAGFLLGAIVGGDEGSIIMIAGGGVGLVGLYRHLR